MKEYSVSFTVSVVMECFIEAHNPEEAIQKWERGEHEPGSICDWLDDYANFCVEECKCNT